MNNLSDNEILNFALDNGIIDISTIQKQIEMNERNKFLEMHQSKIWQSTDGKWYTYVEDPSKVDRRLIKRSTKKALEDAIVNAYKEIEEEPTIEVVFYEWLNRKLKYNEIQPQTYDRYKVDFDRYFRNTTLKDRKVKYIDSNTLEDFILDTIKDRGMTNKAWANLRTLIRGTLKYAKKRGYTNFDVMEFLNYLDLSKKMFKRKVRQDEDNVFTTEEMKMIVDYCLKEPTIHNLAILFAAYTGMRVGEVTALKWEDITDTKIIVHRNQIEYKDEHGNNIRTISDHTKTEAGMRDVAIIPQLKPIIKRIKLINTFTEYVFESNGKIILKSVLCRKLRTICKNLGINPRGMHVLRKTFITNMINGKVEQAIILSQSGHTDIATSLSYYYYNNKSVEYIAETVAKSINY